MVAFAGAIEITRQREFDYYDETMADVARRQFGRLNKDQFPLTQASLDIFTRSSEEKIDRLFRAAVMSFATQFAEDEAVVLSALNGDR